MVAEAAAVAGADAFATELVGAGAWVAVLGDAGGVTFATGAARSGATTELAVVDFAAAVPAAAVPATAGPATDVLAELL